MVDAIRSGMFGEAGVFEPLLGTLFEGKDHYLVSDDFLSYLQAQKMVDEAYVDQPSWVEKTSACRLFFRALVGPLLNPVLRAQSTAPLVWGASPATAPSCNTPKVRSLPSSSLPHVPVSPRSSTPLTDTLPRLRYRDLEHRAYQDPPRRLDKHLRLAFSRSSASTRLPTFPAKFSVQVSRCLAVHYVQNQPFLAVVQALSSRC